MDYAIIGALIELGFFGLLFGVGLAIAAKKFAVEVDPRVEQVMEVLPNANCGACGYPGCSGFAVAVAEGKAPVSGCVPGGAAVAAKIAELMGAEAEEKEPLVAHLLCNGNTNNAKFIAEYDGIYDCNAAIMMGQAGKQCQFSCVGFGTCVKACNFDAMKIVDGIVEIDEEKCTGCGACVEVCPRNVLKLAPPRLNHVFIKCNSHDKGKDAKSACKVACIGCGACAKVCPYDAIEMQDNLAVMDYEKCTSCGICANVCPTNTIHDLLAERNVAVIDDKCIGCTMCAKVCPSQCISGEKKELHVVDTTNCVGCEHCYIVCPVDAITMKPRKEVGTERAKRIKLTKTNPPKIRKRPTHWDSPGNAAVKVKKKA